MHPLRILIADDQRDCRESLARLLRLMGHQVWPVASGEAVRKTAQLLHPNLILVDIGMPGVDGYEVARRLRTMDHRAAVIALSGLATEDDKRKATIAGFDGHLAKPVSMATLERLIDNIAANQLAAVS